MIYNVFLIVGKMNHGINRMVKYGVSWVFFEFPQNIPSGYLTVRHGSHGPNRNRWLTVLNSMVDLSMAGPVSHNHMVTKPFFLVSNTKPAVFWNGLQHE